MEQRRERGLKRLADGRWQFSWCYEGRYHRRVATTKGEARAYLEKLHTLIREGRYMDRRKEVKTTIEEAVKKFLVWSEVNVRPSTFHNDKHYTDLWLASNHFAGKRLDKITPTDVEAYKAQRVTGPSKVSQRTTDADLGRLRRLFSLCVTWGLCEKNPRQSRQVLQPRMPKRALSHSRGGSSTHRTRATISPPLYQVCRKYRSPPSRDVDSNLGPD